MKKIVIISSLVLFCATAFSQTKPTDKGHGETAIGKIVFPKPAQYIIVMNEGQLMELFGFIQNADMWSDKGRATYADKLRTMIMVVPQTDSVASGKTKTPVDSVQKK